MSKKASTKKTTKKKKEVEEKPTPAKSPASSKPPEKPSVTVVEDKSVPKVPEKEAPKKPKPTEPKVEKAEEKAPETPTLDTLSVEAVDGIGPKIAENLKTVGVNTLEELVKADLNAIYPKIKMPIHKLMEYETKAEKILELELDDNIINALSAKNYTIEQAIEEDPKILMVTAKRGKNDIMDFLRKVIQVTMFLDAEACRTNSVAILHRAKKKVPKTVKPRKPRKPGGITADTLDNLSVEAIDGVGPTLTEQLNNAGIETLDHLMSANPIGIYKNVKVPVHKMMEYKKKAQMILQLELDDEIIDTLAAKDYTIAQAIEEDSEVIEKISGRDQDQVLEFIDNVVQITLFLDAATCRSNSVSLLHKSKKEEKPKEPEWEEIRYLGKDQILGKIYSTELDFTVFKLLRDRARGKNEILTILEGKLMTCSQRELRDVLDLMVQTELVQMEWFEGNFDVHLFLISDFTVLRTPAFIIVEEAKKNLPTPMVAIEYLEAVGQFFATYKANPEDNLFISELLRDPDIFVTLSLIRGRTYPLKKFPKGMGDGVDMKSIIDKMVKAGIVKIIADETKQEWVLLLTDLRAPQFYPEYMVENIRRDAFDKKINEEMAIKHLNLLEIHYDTFFEIYSQFFQSD